MSPISASSLGRSMTRVIKTLYNKSGQINREDLDIACELLEKGGVIAMPTDTLYGLAAKVDNQIALDKIYKIKGRDQKKPLAVCLPKHDDIKHIADTTKLHPLILSSLLPGPITIILPRLESLNPKLNPGLENIGVRVPDHTFAMALSHVVGPLALTSANRSGQASPICVEEFEELWPELDAVFDSGKLQNRDGLISLEEETYRLKLGSTVVDLSKPRAYTIIRPGSGLNRTVNILNRFGYKNLTIRN